jgi:hypothetical protein
MSAFAVVAVALAPFDLAAQRSVSYTLRSDTLPTLTVNVSSEFVYLGRLAYDVGTTAQAEEFVFADTAGGMLRRAVVVHFEHFLASNSHTFEYPRLTMAQLGTHEYLHQTWALRDFELFQLEPVKAFLAARQLRAEASWLVDRYVRAVDEAHKHEVIFFYAEAASVNEAGIHYGGAPSEPPPPPAPPPAVLRGLLERAQRAFTISDKR